MKKLSERMRQMVVYKEIQHTVDPLISGWADEVAQLEAINTKLLEALEHILSANILQWDDANRKAKEAIAKAKELSPCQTG